MATDLNETKREKAKRYLTEIRDYAAKTLGIRRIAALKTDDIKGDIKKYVKFAGDIEKGAKSIKYTELAKIARQYKMEMKKAYTEYLKNCKKLTQYNRSDGETMYRSECSTTIYALALSLINVVLIQAQNMLTIYDIAYKFSVDLKTSKNFPQSPMCHAPGSSLSAPEYNAPNVLPSAPPLP